MTGASSPDEIRDLALNQPSAIKPYRWWTFEIPISLCFG